VVGPEAHSDSLTPKGGRRLRRTEALSNLNSACLPGNLVRPLQSRRAVAILTLLILTASAFVTLGVVPSPTRAESGASAAPLLHDDFTHDTSLNTNLWQINGTVGSVLGQDQCGGPCETILLEPTFSSAGMEIAQVNTSFTVGTIQSIESFTPPFTATAVVEGTVSRGHTFGFAIASTNASSGVAIIGNLNSTDCSSLGNCGDPATCGISANPAAIPSNQCYYGIYARIANEGGHWKKVAPNLYLTPSMGVYYTLQVSVDASGSAQYSLSQGGHVINESTAQIGSGPFWVIIEQGEGAPVPGHGPNQAYWMSVSLTSGTSTSSTSTSSTSTSPSSAGISVDIWIVVVIIIIIILFLMILLWYRRRRLTVTVRDSQKLSPIPRATVSANGPVNLSGTTENNGQVVFTNPKKGDYSIQAIAAGYNPSIPVTVSVKKTIEFTVRLDRIAPGAQEGVVSNAPSEGPGRDKVIGLDEGKASLHGSGVMAQSPSLQTQQPQTGVTQPTQQGSAPAVTQTESASSPSDQQGLDELEGWGGERIRQIIRTFQMKGAISPETALTAQELGLSRLFVRIMKRRKGRTRFFVEINGRYYLNQKALQEMK